MFRADRLTDRNDDVKSSFSHTIPNDKYFHVDFLYALRLTSKKLIVLSAPPYILVIFRP